MEELKDKAPRNRREMHLLTLPLLTTGMQGRRRRAGIIVDEGVPVLEKLAEEFCVDIVLIAFEESIYSMLQAYRKKRQLKSFDILSEADIRKAKELALLAENKSLSLFLGAGCSIGAGLPSWGVLLEKIAAHAKMSKEDTDRLWNLSLLNQAKLLENR